MINPMKCFNLAIVATVACAALTIVYVELEVLLTATVFAGLGIVSLIAACFELNDA